LLDSIYFGRLTFTPLAFLKRNILQGISVFYGQSPFHFYFTSALPFICFTTLPYTLFGTWSALSSSSRPFRRVKDLEGLRALAQVTLVFIAAMSLLSHKEVRFLQPIAPALHVFEGYALSMLPSLQTIWKGRSTVEPNLRPSLYKSSPPKSVSSSSKNLYRVKESLTAIHQRQGIAATVLLGLHIGPILYMSLHSMGQIKVVERVGQLSRSGQLGQIGFLMPCHSTPWMSHMHDRRLHQANNAWFISCEPPLQGWVPSAVLIFISPCAVLTFFHNLMSFHSQDMKTYKDESDIFYDDPYEYLLGRFSSKESWPSHLALFEALLPVKGEANITVSSLLERQGYKVQHRFWNSLFHLDSRRRGRVILMKRSHP
jgi:phosphatidylinositol glycan class B